MQQLRLQKQQELLAMAILTMLQPAILQVRQLMILGQQPQ
jgi:hypothetical protein